MATAIARPAPKRAARSPAFASASAHVDVGEDDVAALGDEVRGDREAEPLGGARDQRDPAREPAARAVTGRDLLAVRLGLPGLDEPPLAIGEVPHATQAQGALADPQGVEVDVAGGVRLRPGVAGGEQAEPGHDHDDRRPPRR